MYTKQQQNNIVVIAKLYLSASMSLIEHYELGKLENFNKVFSNLDRIKRLPQEDFNTYLKMQLKREEKIADELQLWTPSVLIATKELM